MNHDTVPRLLDGHKEAILDHLERYAHVPLDRPQAWSLIELQVRAMACLNLVGGRWVNTVNGPPRTSRAEREKDANEIAEALRVARDLMARKHAKEPELYRELLTNWAREPDGRDTLKEALAGLNHLIATYETVAEWNHHDGKLVGTGKLSPFHVRLLAQVYDQVTMEPAPSLGKGFVGFVELILDALGIAMKQTGIKDAIRNARRRAAL